MNALPGAIVQLILSHMTDARDVAACTCVSKCWKESIRFIRSLYFPRNSFDNSNTNPDAIIGKMISSAVWLEELIIFCPFSTKNLALWLSIRSQSLRHLELCMDNLVEERIPLMSVTELDCIGLAKGLESLKLRGVLINQPPNWGKLHCLRSLEIIGARLDNSALSDTIEACPNLSSLSLLGCDGVVSVSITLQQLKQCRVDFYGSGYCSLNICAPKLQLLDVQGCCWIHVHENHCLKDLSISNNAGKVCKVDFGKLPALEFLSIQGVQWTWSAISHILQCSSEVKHLFMEIEFCRESNRLPPFPEIDLVQFFNSHPKLKKFEIHGAMFAALCQKNSLKSLDSRFSIPCLENVVITVRSARHAEQKMSTLKSIVKYSQKLQRMVIRVSQMKNCRRNADDFFEDVCKFEHVNHEVVQIEWGSSLPVC